MSEHALYVFGTSILWGQGHEEESKIHSRIRAYLEAKNCQPVRVHQGAHSGAALKGRPGPGRKRLHGEVPDYWPSIATQVQEAPRARRESVVILFDGGINDVGVFKIVSPFSPRRHIIERTRKFCYNDALDILGDVVRRYPGAATYVLGYYQILASQVRKRELERLLVGLRICEPEDLVGLDFVSRSVDNCRVFWRESTRQLKRAAEAANQRAAARGGSVTFVPSGFKSTEGLFGKRPLLFGLGQIDPMFDDRIAPCTRAIVRGRSGLHCQFAGTGHPNTRGILRYVSRLKTFIGG